MKAVMPNTISTAMTAAETGHLVVGTLHTVDAAQSIDRVIDMYPFGQQQQVPTGDVTPGDAPRLAVADHQGPRAGQVPQRLG